MTNYPNGVASFGIPLLGGLSNVLETGQVFFVQSTTGSNANDGTSPERPFATIAGALAQCLAGRGDRIILMRNHAETISAAAGIALDKSGVTIEGCGTGSQRPTLTWATSTAATITVTAAGVTLRNIICTSTIAGLVKLFSVTAAYATFDTVDYFEDGSTDALQFILTTAAADDLTVVNCRWYRGVTAASALSQWIVLTGADRARIVNNFGILKGFATSNPANGWFVGATTASLGILIAGNMLYDSNSTGNIPISMLTATTGIITRNVGGTSKTAAVGAVAPASCFASENYFSNEVAKSGLLDPAADTT